MGGKGRDCVREPPRIPEEDTKVEGGAVCWRRHEVRKGSCFQQKDGCTTQRGLRGRENRGPIQSLQTPPSRLLTSLTPTAASPEVDGRSVSTQGHPGSERHRTLKLSGTEELWGHWEGPSCSCGLACSDSSAFRMTFLGKQVKVLNRHKLPVRR